MFHSFNRQSGQDSFLWSDRAIFVAELNAPVSHVEVDVVGIGSGSYGRLEIYDAVGNLIDRVTSELISNLQSETLSITDPSGRIASLRFFGHANTRIALEALRFEIPSVTTTDASGGWRLPNLPDGSYRVTLQPHALIHDFESASFEVQVSGSSAPVVTAPARRIANPRHNSVLNVDVNGDGELLTQDAFIVINDLGVNQPRLLTRDEPTGAFIDVNNDGSVTSLDALIVINALTRQSAGEPESHRAQTEPTALAAGIEPAALAADAGQAADDISGSALAAGMYRDSPAASAVPLTNLRYPDSIETTLEHAAIGKNSAISFDLAEAPSPKPTDEILAQWPNLSSVDTDPIKLMDSSDWTGRRDPADQGTDITDSDGSGADRDKTNLGIDSPEPGLRFKNQPLFEGTIEANLIAKTGDSTTKHDFEG